MNHYLDQVSESTLGERLGRVSRLWKTVADHELAPLGLTHPRWTAIWKLKRMVGQVTQKQLAEALDVEVASLMRTLGQLEEQGLVVRHACAQDKRARIVELTEAGNILIESLQSHIIKARSELLVGIDPEDLRRFDAVVSQITENALAQLNPSGDDV